MKIPDFTPLNLRQLVEIKQSPQIFQDCYLVSTLHALTKSCKGRQLLARNIQSSNNTSDIAFKINFPSYPQDNFYITSKNIENLHLTDKYCNTIEHGKKENPAIKAVELAMNGLINMHSSAKPWICRRARCNELFEFNLVSNFMKIFTGKTPYTLNEKTLLISLKTKRKETEALLERLSKEKKFSFVAGTGPALGEKLRGWHCYVVDKVDNNKKLLYLIDKREPKPICLPFEFAIRQIKYFVGYFSEDL